MNWKILLSGLALVFILISASSVPLYSQSHYYQGKTVTILVSTDAGGTADLRVKALAPSLQKHIPGSPTIVTEYMPGGGGRKAANHVYRSVRPDGLTIGSMGTTLVSAALLGESGVLYNVDRFIYLGAQSVGPQIYNTARLFAYLLGLKEPKYVVGYTGPEIAIALQRGEVDADPISSAR
jgi:tripartite-type tricarboxylate transporter receptor subunit TctC